MKIHTERKLRYVAHIFHISINKKVKFKQFFFCLAFAVSVLFDHHCWCLRWLDIHYRRRNISTWIALITVLHRVNCPMGMTDRWSGRFQYLLGNLTSFYALRRATLSWRHIIHSFCTNFNKLLLTSFCHCPREEKSPKLTEYILVSMCDCSLAFEITEKKLSKHTKSFLCVLGFTFSHSFASSAYRLWSPSISRLRLLFPNTNTKKTKR